MQRMEFELEELPVTVAVGLSLEDTDLGIDAFLISDN